jgi:(1->4)-alpha-D-glucan 1-alpha-D-glucosylmutase
LRSIGARVPGATYRLQFNARFTFRDAERVVQYLDALGITDAYASSYLRAVPGSSHGYDIVDPTQLNPEIGSDTDYRAWIRELQSRGMGHILDVVPNHMGIAASANPWWNDVLENGACSRYARFFDIEWRPVTAELANKVLIPILGDQYGAVLERQELKLEYAEGAFAAVYFDNRLPIAPDTYGRILRPGFDGWLEANRHSVATADEDELRSVLTAAENLPARDARDPEAITVRAREKEVVKRRLAAVVERSPALAAWVDSSLGRLRGCTGQPRSFDALDALLNEQSYRLAHWRVASEEINYRRFFDVNSLAALRVEDPVVHDEVHRFVMELVASGAATGLRIDHVDGLFAPAEYLQRLQEKAAAAQSAPYVPGDRPVYVVVEKILGLDEQLRGDWAVHGTTGYDFAAMVNSLFVDRSHAREMDELYTRFLGDRRQQPVFGDLAYRSKKLIMHETMSGDINSLAHQIQRFCGKNRHFRDFTLYSLISTIKEIIASFPVYRTYVTPGDPVSDQERLAIAQAIRSARRRAPRVTRVVFDFLERLLLKEVAVSTDEDREELGRLIGKFQQITSPVMAKGVEDTTFYVYNRLLSLNEVGSDPTVFGLAPDAVHSWMVERHRRWPASLSTTATHDTKRGEDVRARLNVLSEIPGEWKAAVTRWRALNRRFKSDVGGTVVPGPNEEYLLYQTLVGAWPFARDDEPAFIERLLAYLTKALREAKVNTSWLSPDDSYEEGVRSFVRAILDRRRPFLQAFEPFQARVAELGIWNSLSQLLLKIAAPGVPDFYQGTELWDLSLVDPDNRRPVDYRARQSLLDDLSAASPDEGRLAETLVEHRSDGRIKLFATTRALHARRRMPEVFERGVYVPIETAGKHHESLFAFARVHDRGMAVVCVPRLVARLTGAAARPPLGREVWEDTRILMPSVPPSAALRHVFTGARVETHGAAGGRSVNAADLFDRIPIALLVSERDAPSSAARD